MSKQVTDFDAGAFLSKLRETQRENKATIGGRFKWDEGRRGAIKTMAHDVSCLTGGFNGKSYSKALKTLLEKFEKLSARNDINIPDTYRADIAMQLLEELAKNAEAFVSQKNPDSLVALTLYQGTDFIDAQNNVKYKPFEESSWIFKRAATSYPIDPNGFLDSALANSTRMMQDDHYKILQDTPWIITLAAVSYPTDSDGFLDRVMTDMDRLMNNERYESLWDTASIIKRAVVNYPTDPDGFLDKVMIDIERLENDLRYKALREMPSVFKHAVISYAKNPDGFLDKVMTDINRLMKDERYETLREMPSIIKRAAEYSSKDPEAFLDLVMSDEQSKVQSCSSDAAKEQNFIIPSAE